MLGILAALALLVAGSKGGKKAAPNQPRKNTANEAAAGYLQTVLPGWGATAGALGLALTGNKKAAGDLSRGAVNWDEDAARSVGLGGLVPIIGETGGAQNAIVASTAGAANGVADVLKGWGL